MRLATHYYQCGEPNNARGHKGLSNKAYYERD